MSSTSQTVSGHVSGIPVGAGLGSITRHPVLLLHLVALLLHTPLMLVYFKQLWSQPHYQFFPIVLLFVGYVIWNRLPEMQPLTFRSNSVAGNIFLFLAIPFVLFANLTFDVDFASIGCFLIAASLLARTKSPDGKISLLPLVFPLAIAVRLPFGYDIQMISRLQQITSVVSSRLLDVMGIIHMRNGNTIGLPTKQFFVEEACSGVQSLFTLLFFALAWVVWNNHRWFHSTLLVIAAIFWAGFSNTLRVVSICVGEQWFGIDLVAEPAHTIIGYSCLILSMLLLVSTDFILQFALSTGVDLSEEKTTWFARLFGGSRVKKGRKENSTAAGRLVVMGICGLFCLVALIPVVRAGPSVFVRELTGKYLISRIGPEVLGNSFETMTGNSSRPVANWLARDFKYEERELNSDWGSRSSSWQLATDAIGTPLECQFSCDYPFSGWHELSVCYRGNGWDMKSRLVKYAEEKDSWPVVIVDLENRNGSRALLLFSLFDEKGNPIRTPGEDVLSMGFIGRAINTVQQRVSKDYGPKLQTYQVQAFFPGYRSFSDLEKDQLLMAYVQMRKRIVDAIVKTEVSKE